MKFIVLFILIANNLFGSVIERGVIPTIKLLQEEWIGVDLSNYFVIGENEIIFVENPSFNFSVSNDSIWIKPSDQIEGYHPISFMIGGSPFILFSQIESVNNYIFKITHKDLKEAGIISNNNQIFVMGNFNNWNRTSHRLEFNGSNWELSLPFSAGDYEYKFIIDGKEIVDPNNKDLKPNGFGGFNSIFKFNNLIVNNSSLVKDSWDNSAKELKFSIFGEYKNYDELDFQVMFNNQLVESSTYGLKIIGGDLQFNINTHQLENGLLRIYVSRKQSEAIYLENHTILKNGEPLSPLIDKKNFHFKIIYSLMVDRFNNGDKSNDHPIDDIDLHPLVNYHGGDILGVTEKIKDGYFSDLGINTIWLSPIVQGPETAYIESVYPNRKYTGYHGYWPIHSRKIDYRFGTDEELREMIKFAQKQDIDIILDFVSNHTHEQHPYLVEHPEWYGSMYLEDGTLNIRKWSEETMISTWFDSFLPSFDYENNQDAIEQVVSDAIYWIDNYGFAGFRQDATKHVPHKFWKYLRSELDYSFPEKDIFQIGETFGSDELIQSYVNPGELDSQFNFSNYFNLREFIIEEKISVDKIINSIKQNLIQYGPINLMGNLTSSHDQVRFMALVDKQIRLDENGIERAFIDLPKVVKNSNSYDKHFMFTAINMMLPGIPVIYYGEEYGQIGSNDPGNRLNMRFPNNWIDEERKLFEKVKMLIHARKVNSSLALGDLFFIVNDDNGFICKKKYFDEESLFIFNVTDKENIIEWIPESDGKWLSFFDRSTLKINDGKTKVLLKPYETRSYYLNE